jgi:hypothetical protein
MINIVGGGGVVLMGFHVPLSAVNKLFSGVAENQKVRLNHDYVSYALSL